MGEEKSVICDSSTLVCLSNTALMSSVDFISRNLEVKFYIPSEVYKEAIERPDHMRAHAWSAIKIKQMVDKGSISVIREAPKEFMALADRIGSLSNNCFFAGSEPIKILHPGEIHMLSIAKQLGIKSMAIDERTTRVLFENPALLKEHLETEFRTRINMSVKSVAELQEMFNGFCFFRSTELLYLAYRKGYFRSFRDDMHKAFHYALYALKYHGCSISFKEIDSLVSRANIYKPV